MRSNSKKFKRQAPNLQKASKKTLSTKRVLSWDAGIVFDPASILVVSDVRDHLVALALTRLLAGLGQRI